MGLHHTARRILLRVLVLVDAANYVLLRYVLLRILVLADAMGRRLRPRDAANTTIIDGDVTPGSRSMLCVFAHYDRDGIIDDYVIHYLEALARLGCETVFVSTAPGLDANCIERIRPLTTRIILRENRGYDFGSWRDGLATCGELTRYDRLLIVNDSVYGPIRDLGEVFETMRDRGAPAWGITDSLVYVHHLQSYFLVFERPVLESDVFQDFWRELPDHLFKHSVIVQGELGLSRRLARAGFELAALCDYRTLAQDIKRKFDSANWLNTPVNATHWGWKALVEKHGCPFIKVQLLRDNPKGIEDAETWEETIKAISDYDTALIRRHLERMTGGS